VFQSRLSFNPPLQPAIRKFGLVFFGSLLFHVAGTWTMPLIDRDEPRFAEASREMLQRSDYVIPYLNNRYRFDKPPLTYWAQITSYRIFGESDFAARLPSTLAAAATALLLFAWGRRIAGDRIGLWAALIFTLCFQVFLHGKAAVADMWLVLFVTAAHWAGYELLRDRLGGEATVSTRKWWWIFYLALALAFLAKGPIGWTPLLTLACAKFFLRDVKLNSRFWFIPGLLLTLGIVALWGVPALIRTNGEFFNVGIGKHVVERSVVAMEGHGAKSFSSYLFSLPFYFLAIFLTFFPWSIKLPWLTRKLWRERDPLDKYLIAGAAVVFIVFTLVKTKLPHYTLPAFPLLALLLAKSLPTLPNAERFVRRAAITGVAAAVLAVCASPVLARFCPSLQLMRQARTDLTTEMEFGSVEYKEPSLIWYFRRHVSGWLADLDETTVRPFMEKPGGRFVIVPTALAASLYPALPAGWKSYTTRGLNTANGKWLDLTLILKRS
jgi:4-amino-4-deoxy-L-arabinose transferase-like glycosyltransferase